MTPAPAAPPNLRSARGGRGLLNDGTECLRPLPNSVRNAKSPSCGPLLSSGLRGLRGGMECRGGGLPHEQPSAVRDSATHTQHPIFFMYEVPSGAQTRVARWRGQAAPTRAQSTERERKAGVVATASAAIGGTPSSAQRPVQDLTTLWQRLHSVPRGAHGHGRLARAAEEFARAAIAAQDTGLRRHALQSLVRELDRQHAALATRLSRERRDCPHTTQLRNWVVHVKRRVRAAMLRASAPLDAPDHGKGEDAGHGRWPPPRAANLDGAKLGAGHAHTMNFHDPTFLGLRQFEYVPGIRRAGQALVRARASRADLAAASAAVAAEAEDCPLEGLRSLEYRGQTERGTSAQVTQLPGKVGAGRAPEQRRACGGPGAARAVARRAATRVATKSQALVGEQDAKVTVSCFFVATRARTFPNVRRRMAGEKILDARPIPAPSSSSCPPPDGKRISRFFVCAST
jgi:hypothetical protein